MPNQIVQVDENMLETRLDRLVSEKVEQFPNAMLATVDAMLPGARYQRCVVHFMRNVLSKVSHRHMTWAASALKAVFAKESRQAALEKAGQVAAEMESRGLKAAASCLRYLYYLDECICDLRGAVSSAYMILITR